MLVVGASRGIGRASALLLAEEGARLVLVARGEEALQAVASEVRDRGGEVCWVPADVTDPLQAARILEPLREEGIDALVHAVGGGIRVPFAEADDATWQQALELNLLTARCGWCGSCSPPCGRAGGSSS